MMPASSKSNKLLSLRELHLTPRFIYMIDKADFSDNKQYALEIWKGSLHLT
jgi:hypothetical protein